MIVYLLSSAKRDEFSPRTIGEENLNHRSCVSFKPQATFDCEVFFTRQVLHLGPVFGEPSALRIDLSDDLFQAAGKAAAAAYAHAADVTASRALGEME